VWKRWIGFFLFVFVGSAIKDAKVDFCHRIQKQNCHVTDRPTQLIYMIYTWTILQNRKMTYMV
jgi:hypothetical protein